MVNKIDRLIVVLDNVRSALNTGSIFRTADALGAEKIFLCGVTPFPGQGGKAGRELAKTALGAETYLSWEKVKRIGVVIKQLRRAGFQIVAIEQDNCAIDIRKFKPRRKCALILGNEIRGLDRRVLKQCDKIIYIPMFGKKESLNVAVAFGIAGYLIKFSRLS